MSKREQVLAKVVRLRKDGELTAARRLCQQQLRKTHDIQLLIELGIINGLMGMFAEAVECFERLIKRYPENAVAHYYLGKSHAMQGDYAQAISGFEQAIRHDPSYREAWLSLAVTNSDHGNFEQAAEYSRAVIERWPEYGKAYHVLSTTRKFEALDDDVEVLKSGLTVIGMTAINRANVCFALAKVNDDLGDFEQAFKYLDQANSIMRQQRDYDVAKDVRLLTSIRQFFTREFFSTAPVNNGAGHNAIFIVGMPRSGTTLVEQVLASHRQVQAMGEMEYLRRAVWGVSNKMIGTPFPGNVYSLNEVDLATMAAWYLSRFELNEHLRFTDKLPSNFMLIGMIRLLFPEAKIIHCRRDPVDTCLACYRQYFYGAIDYSYSLSDLGHYWLAYDQLMQHWHQVLPGFIHDVHYESLVSDIAHEARRLLAFCDLEWQDQCLEPHKLKRSVQTASVAQVRQPVYQTSIEKWRRYEAYLDPLFAILGRPE